MSNHSIEANPPDQGDCLPLEAVQKRPLAQTYPSGASSDGSGIKNEEFCAEILVAVVHFGEATSYGNEAGTQAIPGANKTIPRRPCPNYEHSSTPSESH
ncbi:hypothetical protein MRX96_052779 [Rhipicephalus microplus]